MSSEKNCIDLYGERLNIGDEVIPVLSEALIMNIRGIISKIIYQDGYHFLILSGKDGKKLYSNHDGDYAFESRHFTTQERFNERENERNVYSLTFYSNIAWPLTSLPLTNRTNPNYDFPEGTTFISLTTNHILDEDKGYISSDIYFFATKDKVKFCYDKKHDTNFLKVLETGEYWAWITGNHINFETYEELKNYIKGLIKYFNNADLTQVNNDIIYSKNPEGKKFEKVLIKELKNNTIK